MDVSVVINTLNEEKNIKRAIASVKKFANEIIVVDMESHDDTVKLARSLGAKVYSHKPTLYVEPARNFAIQKAKGPWIFVLDADEEAPLDLLNSLTKIADDDLADFVRVPRKNIIFGKWMKHSRWWPDYNIRFFKKRAVTWENDIHSVPVTLGRGFDIEASGDTSISHHNYNTIEQYLDRLNRYTTIQAKELYGKDRKFKWSDFISRPVGEFLSRYFAGAGFKDGVHGLAVSLLQGFSEFVVYVKLWQLGGFEDKSVPLAEVVSELSKAQKEINYWKAHAQVQEGGGVTSRIKRKLKI